MLKAEARKGINLPPKFGLEEASAPTYLYCGQKNKNILLEMHSMRKETSLYKQTSSLHRKDFPFCLAPFGGLIHLVEIWWRFFIKLMDGLR
ncbi:hypothetical protein [Nostoc sp. C117]|uniref:hypothetical protein n=1 Tax=Nostoc sp. C117 TaxID=3349875 RepID=UPI00370D0739